MNNMTIGLCGDLKFGRTVHSLSQRALTRYRQALNLYCISPDRTADSKLYHAKMSCVPTIFLMTEVEPSGGCACHELDVLYMTRVQKERFFNEEDYVRLKDFYILTAKQKWSSLQNDMIVLHPLPQCQRNFRRSR